MKIKFTRTPPAPDYSAYIEGEEVEMDDVKARYLIGLGVAVDVVRSGLRSGTRHVSHRTEIVGENNKTEVIVEGRGANIVRVHDPENDPMAEELRDPNRDGGPPVDGRVGNADLREAVSRATSQGLVKQEASRTGGFEDNTSGVDLENPQPAGGVTNDGSSKPDFESDSETAGPAAGEGPPNPRGETGDDDETPSPRGRRRASAQK